MKQTGIGLIVLLLLAACGDAPQPAKTMQTTSIEWDVVAASDSTAQHVMKNSNLIFMR